GIRDFHVTGVQTCALPIFRITPKLLDLLVQLFLCACLSLVVFGSLREFMEQSGDFLADLDRTLPMIEQAAGAHERIFEAIASVAASGPVEPQVDIHRFPDE